jgi:hypothetical protein
MLRPVTHEEVYPLLPAYAAGALDLDASDAVRAHLAGGCGACLQHVFGRRVGVEPRALPAPAGEPTAGDPAPSSRPTADRPGRALAAAVVTLALALAAAVGWMVVELRARETAARAEVARTAERLAEAQAARVDLTGRLDALEREVAALRNAEAEAAHAATEAALRDDLDAAHTRIDALGQVLRRRERELERLRLGVDGGDPLRATIAAPGVELLPLRAVPPFQDARGHALWRPGAASVLLWAFDLPAPPAGGSYRVRVTLADGRALAPRPLGVDGRGQASAPVPLDGAGGSPQEIDVVLEPAGRPVLQWRRAAG